MANTVRAASMRFPVTPVHGGAGLAVAAVTGLAASASPADHSIEVALITTVGGCVAIAVGQLIQGWRERHPRVDHTVEHTNEQAELAMRTVDHLIDEISDRDRLLAERDAEIARLKRRRRAP